MNHVAVNPKTELDWIGTLGTNAAHDAAQHVFPIDGKALHHMEGIGQAHAGFVVIELDGPVLGESVRREVGLKGSSARL